MIAAERHSYIHGCLLLIGGKMREETIEIEKSAIEKITGTKLADRVDQISEQCGTKVNILGVEYRIIIADKEEKPKLKEADGYMDQTIREIVVEKFERDLMTVKDLDHYTKKVLRHEIIHAFLYESGLWNNSEKVEAWAVSEEIVDWIAIQSPKIFKVFEEAGAL